MAKAIDFSEVTLRSKITTRGGGIEIDLTRFGFRGEKMSAYQNYLGGDMLGSIAVNDTIRAFDNECTVKQSEKIRPYCLRLQKHYFTLVNGEFDKEAFKELQCRSVSAY